MDREGKELLSKQWGNEKSLTTNYTKSHNEIPKLVGNGFKPFPINSGTVKNRSLQIHCSE